TARPRGAAGEAAARATGARDRRLRRRRPRGAGGDRARWLRNRGGAAAAVLAGAAGGGRTNPEGDARQMTMEIREAYRFCERATRGAAANFFYGIRLLPTQKRQAMCAAYTFARRVDD